MVNTVRQIRSNTMEKPRLKVFFSQPEGEVTTLWEGLLENGRADEILERG